MSTKSNCQNLYISILQEQKTDANVFYLMYFDKTQLCDQFIDFKEERKLCRAIGNQVKGKDDKGSPYDRIVANETIKGDGDLAWKISNIGYRHIESKLWRGLSMGSRIRYSFKS